MCLSLRIGSEKPYNKSKIRWKQAEFLVRNGRICILSYFQGSVYKPNSWMRSSAKGDIRNVGFHVFVNRDSCAKPSSSELSECGIVTLKIKVDGFFRSGSFGRHKSETWKYMRIVKIIYPEDYTGPKLKLRKAGKLKPSRAVYTR